jgi:hypothetical protein
LLDGLLIFGGEGDNNQSLDDFHLLLIKDWSWKKLFLLQYPSARQQHSIISISETSLIIFGGISLPYK